MPLVQSGPIIILYYKHVLGGTFSEYFYGMKRITAAGAKLSRNHTIFNLIIVVGHSYIRRKLERLYDDLSVKSADGLLSTNVSF